MDKQKNNEDIKKLKEKIYFKSTDLIDINQWILQIDGVDHINIYSKGETELGRKLSNFYLKSFTHPEYGDFKSIEGFYYWLKTGLIHDELRNLYGFKAKEIGRTFPIVHREHFIDSICYAIYCCLEQHPDIKKEIKESQLPFTHYYVSYGVKVTPKNTEWLVEFFTKYRKSLHKR